MMWKLDSASCKLQSPKDIFPRSASNFPQFKPKIIAGAFNSRYQERIKRYRYQYFTISNFCHYVLIRSFFFVNERRKKLTDEIEEVFIYRP